MSDLSDTPTPHGPDFIFIGAPRSGSTWLHKNLAHHPAVWLPPLKNLQFAHPAARHNKLRIARQILRGLIPIKVAQLGWLWRFFTGNPQSADWYKSLFPVPENGVVYGEISEDLMTLATNDIARYAALNPQLKIIFFLRDPVERIYSQIKHNFVNNRHRDFTYVRREEYADMLTSDWALERSRYHAALTRWQTHFPASQFFIADYAGLADHPAMLLNALCAFLGIAPDNALLSQAAARINASQEGAVPADLAHIIWPHLRDDVIKLASQFPTAQYWINRYDAA